jgi:hypothetical protein
MKLIVGVDPSPASVSKALAALHVVEQAQHVLHQSHGIADGSSERYTSAIRHYTSDVR